MKIPHVKIPHDRPVYPIKHISKLTSLEPRKIRYLETQGLVEPARTDGNQRLYSGQDLVKIKLIAKLRDQGLSNIAIKQLFKESCLKKKSKKKV
ncbi:hypothetical protein A2V71_00080 [Candidatus Berkelbacteria bacterium RBG_13_40_8]|uniref:HTH merR-type domain-containing protein n=1 Tax=Candidatus Berkelbacteria bacterium RBG_13_40_8 TaxID=1797467 RepID=A0A1F5DM46_9BACT|nr:MAG: hypothetical protein A2V71_00080 [Candidatus Berkelbacteria bacterium RBG_13_40_8]